MNIELNNIYNCDCREGLRALPDNSVDLTVTSPPYDSLRTYQDDEFAWNFDIFKEVADELYRVTKRGGVIVWIVGDEVVNYGETGTSFKQALYFQEIGFKIHDTMIYEKNSSTFPAKVNSKRYSQIFEYMFVFTKGKIRDDIKLIADKRNKWAGWTNWGTKTQYDKEGNLVSNKKNIKPTPEFSLRTNIWKYSVSFNDKTGHPAVFPEKLAEDHILSWSNEGDVVLDPFMGSGTTAKMAMLNGRNYIGFEKNTDYYNVSLARVGKYEGESKAALEVDNSFVNEENGAEEVQVMEESEKEMAAKRDILDKLWAELNDYACTMSSSILKTLKLTFATKANDRRVEKVLKERGLYSGDTAEEVYKQAYVAPEVIKIEEVKIVEDSANMNEELPNEPPVQNELITADISGMSPAAFIRNVAKISPKGIEFKENDSRYYRAEEVETIVANKMAEERERLMESISELIKRELAEIKSEPKSAAPFKLVDNCAAPVDEIELVAENEPIQTVKRGRGRPKGSKNKKGTLSLKGAILNSAVGDEKHDTPRAIAGAYAEEQENL